MCPLPPPEKLLPADSGAPLQATPDLRAGFAEVDITPGPALSLFGYDFRQRKLRPGNAGVHDPLKAKALVLRRGATEVLWLILDLAIIPTRLARRLRKELAEHTGISPEAIIIAATHTHSGPLLADAETAAAWSLTKDPQTGEIPEVAYTEEVCQSLLDLVACAQAKPFPVQALVAQAPLGLGYDRRVRQADGGISMCWDPQEFPALPPQPQGDPTCSVLLLRQRNGERQYVSWSYGLHPVTLGKTSRVVSADFPGLANALLEEPHHHLHALFFQGASGHSHPWHATQENPHVAVEVAKAAASFVRVLCHGAREVRGAGAEPELTCVSATLEVGDLKATPVALDYTLMRLGEVWIVALPVELFEELALKLRAAVDGPLFLCTLAQGWEGYLPDAYAFADGAYEVEVARKIGFLPGDGEKLIAAVLARMDELRS